MEAEGSTAKMVHAHGRHVGAGCRLGIHAGPLAEGLILLLVGFSVGLLEPPKVVLMQQKRKRSGQSRKA